MPSVVVNYHGVCSNTSVQRELLGYVRQLAQQSSAWLRKPAPPVSPLLRQMRGTAPNPGVRLPSVRNFDKVITGRIALDPYLTPATEQLQEQIQHAGNSLISFESGDLDKQEANVLSLDQTPGQYGLLLDELRLRGFDFDLYDPRGLYPVNNRLSFVFLDCPQLPALTGCVAQIENREQCQAYSNATLRAADWFVSIPSLHLRYYLEKWFDLLMCWAKVFYMPELSYCRYESLPQYNEHRGRIESLIHDHGTEGARRVVFQYLLERFEQEAADWHRNTAKTATLTFEQMFSQKAEPTATDTDLIWTSADVDRLLKQQTATGDDLASMPW